MIVWPIHCYTALEPMLLSPIQHREPVCPLLPCEPSKGSISTAGLTLDLPALFTEQQVAVSQTVLAHPAPDCAPTLKLTFPVKEAKLATPEVASCRSMASNSCMRSGTCFLQQLCGIGGSLGLDQTPGHIKSRPANCCPGPIHSTSGTSLTPDYLGRHCAVLADGAVSCSLLASSCGGVADCFWPHVADVACASARGEAGPMPKRAAASWLSSA